ncbi:response regulator transcription factor [Tenacibaculum aiptasiae]|uniref:Response regulator transcription factor n=1 Tax=Tenacibaculum aiptasiae TaxID=426481 RepID=A0A7J5A8J9_9FLAO|nr:response regulator transcription factor [Tenacibaculum aiptasiae]KAB1153837.1 response regulator transcription factor [Tenacibaculum aiptasiae]
MSNQKHILLVEDDESMGFLLKDSLENYHFNVTLFPNGKLALNEFHKNSFDICLLDVMMPIMDGFSLAKEIRKINTNIPVIFLTAKSMKEDKINGFKIGADDYVTKPFNIEELVLRIKAILKRSSAVQTFKNIIPFSNYSLDLDNLILNSNNSEAIQLTQKEADILALFARNKNTLLKRDYILNSVWKDDNYFIGRSLDVFISKLRKHFKNTTSIQIKNIHGTGYKFIVTD